MSWLYQPLLPAIAEIESGPSVGPIDPAYWVGGSGTWNATDPTNWAATSGGAGGAGYPDSNSTVYFDSNSGAGTVTIDGGVCNDFNISVGVSAITLAPTTSGLTIYGNATVSSTNATISGSAAITFAATSSKTVTSGGETFDCPVTFNGTGGTWVLQDNLTVGATRTTTLTAGTLNLNNNTLSTGLFSSSSIFARTLAFGTGGITVTAATTSTVWDTGTTSNLTITGTPVVTTTGAGATTKTINSGTLSGANTISFVLNNTAGTVVFTSGNNVRDLTVGNNAITVSVATLNVYGDMVLGGTSPTLSITTINFLATSGTKNIDVKGKYSGTATFNGAATWKFLSNASFGNTTLTAGTLDLNSYTISINQFSSTNSNVRGLIGPGTITISYGAVGGFIWTTATNTNFSVSGEVNVNVSLFFVDSTGTIVTGGIAESDTCNFNITGGNGSLGVIEIATGSRFRNLTINTGSASFGVSTSAGQNILVYGNFAVTGTAGATQMLGNITMAATSGTKTITSNGTTIRSPLIFDGVGGTWSLVDNVTMLATSTVTLTNGTLDLNGKVFNVGTSFVTAAGTKNLTFNGGTLLCPNANTTSFNNAAPTGFTTTAGTGTGKISMSAATAKTFVGGSSVYNCTLENSGAGALTIQGNNTFANITNSVSPAIFTFTAGSFNVFVDFSISGTPGNIVTINSSTPGTQASLVKGSGTVSVSYCTISDSNASGGASWQAYTANGNTDGGGNTGWIFIPTNVYVTIDNNVVLGAGILISF